MDVNFERYNRTVAIEARTLASMLKREVLPAALRFQGELGPRGLGHARRPA